MTIEQFLSGLEKVKDRFYWAVYGEKIRGIDDKCIFGRVCPIVAVAIPKQNSTFLMHWESADLLGICYDDAVQIMRAADGIEPEHSLRKRILNILNLNEARA